jgi:hypothetical protein
MKALSTVIATLLMTFSAFAAKNVEDVELKWKPTSDMKEITEAKLGSLENTVHVMKFTDSRKVTPQNKVGENKENESTGTILSVTTTTDIADFVTDNFIETLKKSGLSLAGDKADYTLKGDISEYFVTETNTYNGTLIARVTLFKKDKAVWKGNVVGTNKRFGRSFKLDNYYETLSDLVVDFATKLATTKEFKDQLR